ncbi:MAG: hypothetical protein LUG52_10190 [Clostridia bacterium]|nr:hypothetical protein [Clostridia bacterium]
MDKDTGELTSMEHYDVYLTEGSTVKAYSPEQKQIIESKKIQKEYYEKARRELGDFYFIMNASKMGELLPATAARLIYLCTYLDFDNNFMLTQRTPKKAMQKSDLQSVLGLSESGTRKFWDEVSPKYITQSADGLRLNTDEIHRGSIKGADSSYRKIWIRQVRKLYKATPLTRHKHLGYVFQVLPYVNIEYNIICWNIDETDIDEIIPLTLREFCELIDYDVSQASRLIDIYKNITFEYKGKTEYLITFVVNNRDLNGAKFYINPHIVYSGSDYQKVEVLGAFVKKGRRKKIESKVKVK